MFTREYDAMVVQQNLFEVFAGDVRPAPIMTYVMNVKRGETRLDIHFKLPL
jgi:hypothetical protein